jgi:hypothetical protein
MKKYKVTLHRVVEHETTYTILASNEEEAKALILSGNYDNIIDDSEEGEMEDPEVINIEQE